jgi:uncharacterized damage-inducible protein DinB
MAVREGLLAEFDHEMAATRKLLARLPDERLSWKPHDKSMTMGALAAHLASLPQWAATILDRSTFDLVDAPPRPAEATSRETVLGAFDRAVTDARRLLDKTDAELQAPWTLRRGGQEVFTIPRAAAFRSWVLSHSIHHRGQLSVYLRLNDIPVPGVYGASADDI